MNFRAITRGICLATACATFSVTAVTAKDRTLSLHPDNPHYFLWRGQPTVIITSGEHYGAVMNLDFDYATYLKELESKKLNCTRLFSGAYVEPHGAFGIAQNTLAPPAGRYFAPWARSSQPGYANGGNKFDLRMPSTMSTTSVTSRALMSIPSTRMAGCSRCMRR